MRDGISNCAINDVEKDGDQQKAEVFCENKNARHGKDKIGNHIKDNKEILGIRCATVQQRKFYVEPRGKFFGKMDELHREGDKKYRQEV